MAETLTDLVSKLERAHSAFCEALVELGETDRLDERPAQTEWNAREITAHQVNSERALRGFAGGVAPTETDALQGQAGPLAEFERTSVAALVRLLEAERELTLQLLSRGSSADLARACGEAPWGEQLTLGRTLEIIAGHQGHHTAQLNAILRPS